MRGTCPHFQEFRIAYKKFCPDDRYQTTTLYSDRITVRVNHPEDFKISPDGSCLTDVQLLQRIEETVAQYQRERADARAFMKGTGASDFELCLFDNETSHGALLIRIDIFYNNELCKYNSPRITTQSPDEVCDDLREYISDLNALRFVRIKFNQAEYAARAANCLAGTVGKVVKPFHEVYESVKPFTDLIPNPDTPKKPLKKKSNFNAKPHTRAVALYPSTLNDFWEPVSIAGGWLICPEQAVALRIDPIAVVTTATTSTPSDMTQYMATWYLDGQIIGEQESNTVEFSATSSDSGRVQELQIWSPRSSLLNGHRLSVTIWYDDAETGEAGIIESQPMMLTTTGRCGPADIATQSGEIGADDHLTSADVVLFFTSYLAGNVNSGSDIATISGDPVPDGQLTAGDVVVFMSSFFAGCQ